MGVSDLMFREKGSINARSFRENLPQTDFTRALVISRTFVWTFLLKKVLSELSLRLLYVLISYRNNSQSGFAVLATVEPDITMYQGTGRIT